MVNVFDHLQHDDERNAIGRRACGYAQQQAGAMEEILSGLGYRIQHFDCGDIGIFDNYLKGIVGTEVKLLMELICKGAGHECSAREVEFYLFIMTQVLYDTGKRV